MGAARRGTGGDGDGVLQRSSGARGQELRQYEALPRLEKGRALAFGVPDGTWALGACRATWARGARAVVQFGVDAALLCPVLGQAMWRMGR